jgi:hypothetical protein
MAREVMTGCGGMLCKARHRYFCLLAYDHKNPSYLAYQVLAISGGSICFGMKPHPSVRIA